MRTLILIPALNPPDSLIDYVNSLKDKGLNDILIVDDGSRAEFKKIFTKLESIEGIKVLRHAINMGKGRALKNAFNYFLTMPDIHEYNGVVTADSDGQHSPDDVMKLTQELSKCQNSLILGCRNFDNGNVPPKSKFGNKITRKVLKIFYRRCVTDTQTGLRGFPLGILSEMIDIFGERFEYETKMLIYCFEKNIPIKEVEIETIYYDNNSETHFDAIKDSLKIYKVIFSSFLRYIFSAVSSFFLDIGFFNIFLIMFTSLFGKGAKTILISTALARIISSLFNFYVNKNFVFDGEKNTKKTISKYYSLCILLMLLLGISVSILWKATRGSETVIKIIVDTVLFLFSYRIQRIWVFKRRQGE